MTARARRAMTGVVMPDLPDRDRVMLATCLRMVRRLLREDAIDDRSPEARRKLGLILVTAALLALEGDDEALEDLASVAIDTSTESP